MSNKGDWLIRIPAQGIDVSSNGKDQILKFFNDEIAFYIALALNNFNVEFAGSGYGSVSLTPDAVENLTDIVEEIKEGKTAALDQYIEDASTNQVLVGASPMGRRIAETKKTNANVAYFMASILCPKWLRVNNQNAGELIAVFRAVAFANPANFGFDNLIDASRAAKESHEARDLSRSSAKKLEEFISEKTKLIGDLENLYRTQLTIQEPALSWKNIARRKTTVWISWLAFFGFMVVAPLLTALFYWKDVSGAVMTLTASAGGGISISGLAAISVPALFYAWLLKNISRVFIHNLNLADDAAHRRALALTYMGLLRDEQHPATEQDRAIILNALFRPIPPQTSDEGPPAGLIELMKK